MAIIKRTIAVVEVTKEIFGGVFNTKWNDHNLQGSTVRNNYDFHTKEL